MYNHAADSYICPICVGLRGEATEKTLIRPSDFVYRDDMVAVFVASYFIGRNDGHLIVVPVEHFENLYDLPDEIGARIFSISRDMAVAMKKAYGCEGVTTQQNNEPAGGQHAYHYHLHLFPRYANDDIHSHMGQKRQTTPEERQLFAQKIKSSL